jgi:hypothetical protein
MATFIAHVRYNMDSYIFWGHFVLLLPMIIAGALAPACWLRERLLSGMQKQWHEPSWLTHANRHALDCSHPVPLEALTGCLRPRGH